VNETPRSGSGQHFLPLSFKTQPKLLTIFKKINITGKIMGIENSAYMAEKIFITFPVSARVHEHML
jgi:hypothetical protein